MRLLGEDVSKKPRHSVGYSGSHARGLFVITFFALSITLSGCLRDVKHGPIPGVSEALLFRACSQGDLNLVKNLLDQGINVNAREVEGETPLLFAAAEGKTDIVGLLLDRGANINAVSINNETALARAVLNTRHETVILLLDRGADIEKSNPLVYAAGVGDVRMVELLLNKGAKVNAVNSAGNSPLSAAVSRQVSLDVVRLLLKAGADVNHKDKSGETPLMIAEQNGDDAMVNLLKQRIKL